MEKLDYYLNINKTVFNDLNIMPAFREKNVAVVYATSDRYARYLSVSVISLLENSSKDSNYDIIVLETNLSDIYKQKIKDSIEKYQNACLRFINLAERMEAFHPLFYVKGTLKYETYYRLFLDKAFKNYERMLYLDSDTVILSDINKLYGTNTEGYLISCCLDIMTISQTSRKELRERLDMYEYMEEVLEIDYNKYVQCGVILFDLEECREFNFSDKAIQTLYRIPSPFFVDQDIINVICQGRIRFLSPLFNYQSLYKESDMDKIRADFRQGIVVPKADIKILHLTGPKPDRYPFHEFAELFWKYARLSPFYEVFLFDGITGRFNLANPSLQALWQSLIIRIITDLNAVKRDRKKMRRYKLLSMIMVGKARRRYQEKYKGIKAKLGKIEL